MNTPLEAVTVTLIEVYVPAGTDRFEPTRVESVCRRVISYDVGVIGTATNVPEDGVSEIPATGSAKLSMETPVGGRSKRVTLKFALPLPQPVEHPPFFTPLHDPKTRTMTDRAKTNSAFIFITHRKQSSVSGRGRNWAELLRDATSFMKDTGALAPPGQLSKVTGTARDE